ncbi:unnamed protein product [Ilex paraguariensis]|uniref:Uncharacterized protein n=1 Tax=Ilex paraguariensis TaxID=185542 RepID=A0ABC8SLT7_9AQUA
MLPFSLIFKVEHPPLENLENSSPTHFVEAKSVISSLLVELEEVGTILENLEAGFEHSNAVLDSFGAVNEGLDSEGEMGSARSALGSCLGAGLAVLDRPGALGSSLAAASAVSDCSAVLDSFSSAALGSFGMLGNNIFPSRGTEN